MLNDKQRTYKVIFSILLFIFSCDSAENAKYEKSVIGGDISFYPSGIPKMEQFVISDIGKEVIHYFNYQDTFLVKRDDEYFKIFEPRVWKYQFLNSSNDISFEYTYGKNKELKKKFGSSIITYWSPAKVSINEKWLLQLIVPVPPYSLNEIQIFTKMLGKNTEMLISKKLNEVFFEFDTTFSKRGKYEILIISKIETNSTSSKQADSVQFILEVD